MDRDVDAVAMLIENLDHLLIGLLALRVGDGHPDQSAELTHAVIDMHHEVANLELLDLLQRERHLTTTGLVALQVVLMETVEDLMIGKETDAEVVVGKALVERLFNRRKSHIGDCPRCENFLQAFVLLLAVGEDIDLIALQEIVFEGFRQQVEVLVEEGLDGDMEVESEK